ncbi:MAG: molybdenum cofactor guanylyltransferase [Promethearchaeota archaeon]
MLKINHKNKYLAFAILIGGKSTRFGTDKGIFEFHGKPLISYQIETISKFKKDIFLVAHSEEQIQKYALKIKSKNIKGFILDKNDIISDRKIRTPMIGMYSAFKEMSKLGYEKAFILSCDSPLIKYEVVKLLINQSKGFDCCIPRWNNYFLEPLFAIYPVKKIIKIAKQNLLNKSYKLTNLLDINWKINYISIEKEIKPLDVNFVSFININGPVDIKKLIKVYQE